MHEVHKRRYLLRASALELFFREAPAVFLNLLTSPYLPISPHVSPYLPISPGARRLPQPPHAAAPAQAALQAAVGLPALAAGLYISPISPLNLPISPYISLYLGLPALAAGRRPAR